MKLSDAVIDCPMSGICTVDIDKVVKRFGKTGFISRWHDEYRLVNLRASVKVSISKEDALAIIERLGLVECDSLIFRNASTFHRAENAHL